MAIKTRRFYSARKSCSCSMPGVWRAVAYMDGAVVVFHSPRACAHVARTMDINSQYRTLSENEREQWGSVPLLSSQMQEKDAIFGGVARLEKCLRFAIETYKPKCLMIANSCVAGVIGDDVESVAREVEEEYNVPILTVECCGFLGAEYYDGYFEITQKLLERFVKPCAKQKDSVLLLGDNGGPWGHYAKEVTRILQEFGVEVIGQFPGYMAMDELEKVLNIRAYPIKWPIRIDGHYKGVYNRLENTIELFEDDTSHGAKKLKSTTGSLDDPKIRELLGDELYENLCNDIELLDMAGDEFDMEKVNTGELTPMFFGSAMTNFGVQSFLEKFLEMSPMPQPRMLQDGTILSPENEKYSAFVFKIQANMNPAHRDRISFMRICSGVFDKGMSVYHKQSGKMVKLAQPQQFLAQERTIVEKAYPGDIIGVFDPGIFGIGDSLSDSSLKLQFEDFPVFPPEIFARVQPKDSLKRKQFEKGIIQLSQEGAIQVFRQEGVGLESYIVGVVGVLQLEVLEYRLLNEYSSKLLMNQLPYSVARWVYAEDKKLIENIKGLDNGMLVYDKKDRPVILVNNEWSLNWILERNPGIQFLTVPADVEKI